MAKSIRMTHAPTGGAGFAPKGLPGLGKESEKRKGKTAVPRARRKMLRGMNRGRRG